MTSSLITSQEARDNTVITELMRTRHNRPELLLREANPLRLQMHHRLSSLFASFFTAVSTVNIHSSTTIARLTTRQTSGAQNFRCTLWRGRRLLAHA